MHVPEGIRTEILLANGSWVDVSTRARGAAGIRITRGRQNERGRTNTSVNLTLKDPSGDFNPENPRSPYFGLIGPNTQLRCSLGRSAALDDDFNRTVSNSWAGGAVTWTNSGGTVPGDYDVDGTHGTHTHPSANVLHHSTADAGERNHRVRAVVKLSAATLTGANASAWVLGRLTDTNNYYAAVASFETDNDVSIGIYKRVAGVLTPVVAPITTHTVFVDWDDTEFTIELLVEGSKLYAKIWASGSAEREPVAWTLEGADSSLATGDGVGVADRRESGNSNANLQFRYNSFLAVPGTIRAHVEVPNLGALRWTPGGHDVTMPVQGAGIKRRLGVGGIATLRSPMYREITRGDIVPIVGYWPCEETAKVTQIASGLPGGPSLAIVGTDLTFGAASTFPGAASLVRLGAGTQLRANVLSSVDTGQIKTRALIEFPASLADNTPLIEVSQAKDATVRKWRLIYHTGGSLSLVGYSQGGSAVEDTGSIAFDVNDTPLWIGFEVVQDGADVDWVITRYALGSDGSAAGAVSSGTFTTSSVGAVTGAVIAPTGAMDGCAVGQWCIANDTAALDLQLSSLIAHLGESSTERFARLCDEEGIAYQVVGIASSTSSMLMGPQRVATLLQNLEDVEDAEGGILYEARHFFGFVLRTSETLLNQSGLTLSYTDSHLTGEPFPVPDELLRANDVTAARPDGSEYRSVEEAGPTSIENPLTGMGRYLRRVVVPTRNAVDLPDIARWHRHLGTWRGPRYPSIQLDTHRDVFVADTELSDDIDELELGGFLSVDDLPVWLPPEPIEVLAQGYTEVIHNLTRELTLNAVPAGPYLVAARDSGFFRDSAVSVLAADAAVGATSLSVAVAGPLWTTGTVDFEVMVSGSLLHVTNISGASSPQTFTVDATRVNGIDKALSAGDEVHVYPIPRRALTSTSMNFAQASDGTGTLVVGRDTPPSVWVEGESTGAFTSASFIEDADPVGVTFVVPSTGAVMVHIAGELNNDNGTGFTLMSFNVRSTSEIGGGSLRLAASDSRSILVLGTDIIRPARAFRLDGSVVTNFLPGREYNITLAHRRSTAGNASISRRLLLVTPDKTQGGLPGSEIGVEPASDDDVQDASDTTTSTSYTTADMTACGTSFVAPPSGKVLVHLGARIDNSGASSCFVSYRIGAGGTVGAGTQTVAPDDLRSIQSDQVNQIMLGASFPVTGLVAGDTYNVQLMHRVSAGTGTLENRYVAVEPVA